MTKTLHLRSLDVPQFNNFHKFGIGFDSLFDEILRTTARQDTGSYPPYNIIKQSDDAFSIELAIAGFKEGDIEINLEQNLLTISGNKATSIDESPIEYLHQGIGSRNFSRSFTLAEHVEVVGAETADGILTIKLERRVPEEQKAKKIAISYRK